MRTLILSVFALGIIVHYANANNVYKPSIQKAPIGDIKNHKLTVATAIDDAIKYSPQIQSTQSAVIALLASVKQAGYKPNPTIGFNIENIAGRGTYQGVSATEYNAHINQIIEMGGKRMARINAANTTVESERINILIHEQDIKYAVKTLYLENVIALENLKLARLQENMAQKMLAFIAKRVAMAADHETQRSKASFLYQQAITNRKIAQQKLTQAKQKIAIICGYQNTEFDIAEYDFLNIGTLPSRYYSDNLPNIPDLKKFDFIKKEKQAAVALQKANAVPDPTLTAGIRRFNQTSDEAFMLGVSIPIIFHNDNQGNINRANAELEQVNYDRKQTELATKQMLISTYQDLENLYMRLSDIKTKLIPQAQQSFDLAKTAYKNDIFSYIEVMDAQTTLFDIKQQYIQFLQQYHTAKIKMSRLTEIPSYSTAITKSQL